MKYIMAKQKNISVKAQEEREARMPLGRRNYVWMLIGLGVIIVGFLLMASGFC